jgi:branched-chain amino acid transport system permease protein
MKNNLIWKWLALACLLMALAVMPKLLPEFYLNLLITMVIYSLCAVSFNMLLGQTGLLSFGHAAYFGIGAYAPILLFKHFECSLLLGTLAGGVTALLLGIVFGFFVARKSGLPFALLSLAFNALIWGVAEKWRSLTGGEDGLAASRPDLFLPGFGTIDMFSTINFYYFVVIVVVLCITCCWYLTQTPLGKLNLLIRENEQRTAFIGYDTFKTKYLVYLICAFFCGIAGALASIFGEYVATTMINMEKSSDILIMTYVGGRFTFWGPIVGACFLIYINDALSSLTEYWAIVQGTMFIVLVMYAPFGISGLLIRIKDWVWAKQEDNRS